MIIRLFFGGPSDKLKCLICLEIAKHPNNMKPQCCLRNKDIHTAEAVH